jgi:hypothetical protein
MSLSCAAQPPQPETTDDEHPWFLCYFLHRYLDFRLPEAEACAELEGCSKSIAWCAPSPYPPLHLRLTQELDLRAAHAEKQAPTRWGLSRRVFQVDACAVGVKSCRCRPAVFTRQSHA